MRRAFGITPSEKRTPDLMTDHRMIPREHLATWLGVSEGRVSQLVRSLVKDWSLIEHWGKRGDVRYTLSVEASATSTNDTGLSCRARGERNPECPATALVFSERT